MSNQTIKPHRLGSETGSLVNHIYSSAISKTPQVGDGATILSWTDRRAATVTEVSVSGKRIGVVEDVATRTDNLGMSDCQSYEYSPGTGSPSYFTLRKNGAWVREGESLKGGQRIIIGKRDHHYDFSF